MAKWLKTLSEMEAADDITDAQVIKKDKTLWKIWNLSFATNLPINTFHYRNQDTFSSICGPALKGDYHWKQSLFSYVSEEGLWGPKIYVPLLIPLIALKNFKKILGSTKNTFK